ncbi:MAG TPA: cupin domain-containing protein, partial [Spirochaetia bacterium]|nr:cupin domain-containing protein [Spirochaetia bacterium]
GNGSHERVVLGNSLETGEAPQAVVPGGAIQGSRLLPGGRFALLGTTMAPEFISESFALVPRAELIARFPGYAGIIEALTRV